VWVDQDFLDGPRVIARQYFFCRLCVLLGAVAAMRFTVYPTPGEGSRALPVSIRRLMTPECTLADDPARHPDGVFVRRWRR